MPNKISTLTLGAGGRRRGARSLPSARRRASIYDEIGDAGRLLLSFFEIKLKA
jgi:hypothetical protein